MGIGDRHVIEEAFAERFHGGRGCDVVARLKDVPDEGYA